MTLVILKVMNRFSLAPILGVVVLLLTVVTATTNVYAQSSGTVTGELKKWHPISVTFDGPQASETGSPNPFTDYRLNVTFTHPASNTTYVVPGYFAADGNAAETSATSGNKWRAIFSPDQTGQWNYTASFRSGTNVALSLDAGAGSATAFDGASGTFTVAPTDKTGRDNRAQGRLSYVNKNHLQYQESKKYFVKGGADAPENFLNYEDFDQSNNGRTKTWSAHEKDWQSGDPTWQGGKGKGMIGAINYLASEDVNAFSFLTMNVEGDDDNVYPYIDRNEFMRIDVSRTAQWDIVFKHADTKGMYMHFKMLETENDELLDGGDLGNQRKLYYRELIARFGYHLALNWNISEEFDAGSGGSSSATGIRRLKEYSSYIRSVDPYDHIIVLHTRTGGQSEYYGPMVGDKNGLTGVSIQKGLNEVHPETRKWVNESRNAGHPWIVANDEQAPAGTGVTADSGYGGTGSDNHDEVRHKVLWGNLMAGGGGVEYYFGYGEACNDLECEDYRSRDRMWDYTRHALDFFEKYIPFWEMQSNDGLASKGYTYAKDGQSYVVYLPDGGSVDLELASGSYEVKWYDPRNGGSLQNGSVTSVNGGSSVSLGNPPSNSGEDWVVLVQKPGGTPTSVPTSPVASPTSGSGCSANGDLDCSGKRSMLWI